MIFHTYILRHFCDDTVIIFIIEESTKLHTVHLHIRLNANGVFICLRYILALTARRSEAEQLLGVNPVLSESR